jgi:hypothetical protein
VRWRTPNENSASEGFLRGFQCFVQQQKSGGGWNGLQLCTSKVLAAVAGWLSNFWTRKADGRTESVVECMTWLAFAI